jgi:hypothetical protein
MSRVREALHWDGFSPRVSLFLVSRSDTEIDFSRAWEDRPRQVALYRLVDDSDPGRIRVVYEYDFDFDTLPVNLTPQLEACMSMACQTPGSVAWLALEGSFHFDHLLADDSQTRCTDCVRTAMFHWLSSRTNRSRKRCWRSDWLTIATG